MVKVTFAILVAKNLMMKSISKNILKCIVAMNGKKISVPHVIWHLNQGNLFKGFDNKTVTR